MLTEKNSKNLLWLGVFIILSGIVFFFWKESVTIDKKLNSEKIAQFGDFIGGVVGTIWSLAGVLLFYVALKEQRNDIAINRSTLEEQVKALNLQIKEFELQRKELEETREVFKEQSETLKIQRFENTFFQLINLHHEIIDKLSYVCIYDKSEYNQREVFRKSIKILNENINRKNHNNDFIDPKETPPKTIEEAEKRLLNSYLEFYFEDTSQLLSHYYRNIYHIFKFIYTSGLIVKEKKQFYASLIRAQLSSDELTLIYYNSITNNLGYPNFLFLIKEYEIMQNFDLNLVYSNKFYKEIFENKLSNVKPEFKINN